MSLPSEAPTPPEPTSGLADPRTIRQGPEILEAGPDEAPGGTPEDSSPDQAPAREGEEGPDGGARGLVDPRGDIPEPSAP